MARGREGGGGGVAWKRQKRESGRSRMRRGRNDQQEETWRFSYYPPCRYFLKIAVQHFASL